MPICQFEHYGCLAINLGAMNAKASFQARWMPNHHLNRCFECVKPFLEVLMLNVLKHSSLE